MGGITRTEGFPIKMARAGGVTALACQLAARGAAFAGPLINAGWLLWFQASPSERSIRSQPLSECLLAAGILPQAEGHAVDLRPIHAMGVDLMGVAARSCKYPDRLATESAGITPELRQVFLGGDGRGHAPIGVKNDILHRLREHRRARIRLANHESGPVDDLAIADNLQRLIGNIDGNVIASGIVFHP